MSQVGNRKLNNDFEQITETVHGVECNVRMESLAKALLNDSKELLPRRRCILELP